MHTCEMINNVAQLGVEYGRALQERDDAQDAVEFCKEQLQEAIDELHAFTPCNLMPEDAVVLN